MYQRKFEMGRTNAVIFALPWDTQNFYGALLSDLTEDQPIDTKNISWSETKYGKVTVDGNQRSVRLASWYVKYPIIYRVSYLSGGAGFLTSTVLLWVGWSSEICDLRSTEKGGPALWGCIEVEDVKVRWMCWSWTCVFFFWTNFLRRTSWKLPPV